MAATEQYLPAFLAEAREHLQELGLALVRIEAAPDDRGAGDAVFRAAHSLKGMSATMGFAAIAELTHAIEDVLELLRRRAGGLPPTAIDVLSACLDALETAVESIAAGGEERLDPAPLVARLQGLGRARTPVVHVVAELAEDCAMPSVRAFMLLEALRVHGELVGSAPAIDEVEHFSGRRVEAWVATRSSAEALADGARAVADLASVAVRDEEPRPAVPTPAAVPGPVRGASVRVDAERLDELLHLMGELVQQRTAIESLAAEDAVRAASPGLAHAVQRLARTSQALQETVTRVRMVPVESVFLRFPRLVRDLAARLGKQVELRLDGADTELDRTVVDALGDPLVHLVRNALDHGIEEPAARVAAGKPPTAVLELAARHAGGRVIVSVHDDGRGIDPVVVAVAARERGLLPADPAEDAGALDPARATELLFAPGFSTAARTTDVSGRGVGMDAVRERVRALGGEVAMTSTPGRGTTVELRLPLTLASIAALVVEVDAQPFAIPLDRVVRSVRLDGMPIRTVRAAPLLPLGGELVALRGPADRAYAVIVCTGHQRVALTVDALIGQRELVTRPLPRSLNASVAASGGAILPDGSIALVVDCDALSVPATEGVPA